MATIKAFKGLRPKKDFVEQVAELPYDVLNSAEAKEIAGDNPYSFFHVTKPEIGMDSGINVYDESVYKEGKKNLDKLEKDGIMFQDEKPKLYLYTLVMNGRPQTGIIACVSVDDYYENSVKKHELTRNDKEKDRTTHLDILNANTGPVFLLYKEDGTKKSLYKKAMEITPEYDFTAEDGIKHTIRVIEDDELIAAFKKGFKDDILYIADGHHRAASGAKVGEIRRAEKGSFTGDEEFNSFLTVIFPHDELEILAYNRTVKDLNGLSEKDFMEKISKEYDVIDNGVKTPEKIENVSMYISKKWYTLTPKFDVGNDPIDSLDVKILQDRILAPLLGVKDPRTDNRISFIGGIRGTAELEKLVDSGDNVVAFSMYPTTIQQLMDVSDNDKIMPPKSTWFEPKLRSGLLVHKLD